jgi:RNA polymerase sigma-70 factor (ECF subfamily)
VSDFHLLLEEQVPKLIRYATALTRDPDEAGELVEDTVLEALASHSRCRKTGDVRVWLLTILHDLRGNPFRQAAGPVTATRPDPKALLALSQLDRALGQLPEEQRAIILLIGLEGLTYATTAAVLRISLGTMRSRLAHGRAALRGAMGVPDRLPRPARASHRAAA